MSPLIVLAEAGGWKMHKNAICYRSFLVTGTRNNHWELQFFFWKGGCYQSCFSFKNEITGFRRKIKKPVVFLWSFWRVRLLCWLFGLVPGGGRYSSRELIFSIWLWMRHVVCCICVRRLKKPSQREVERISLNLWPLTRHTFWKGKCKFM